MSAASSIRSPPRADGNIVAELSTPVPVAVTGHVLGVPLEDIADARRSALRTPPHRLAGLRLEGSHPPGRGGRSRRVGPELTAYFDQMIDARRNGDVVADDLIAQLVATQVDGEWLTNRRIRSLAINFLTAGLSTTNLISNLLYRLMTSEDFDRRYEQTAG